MADWNQLFKSDAFRAYRRKQAELVANIVSGEITRIEGSASIDRLRGRLEMARLMIRLPENLTQDLSVSDILKDQLSEDMARITQYLIKKEILED